MRPATWLEAGGVRRLILDLRQNPGGDNTTYGPLLELVRDFAAGPARRAARADRPRHLLGGGEPVDRDRAAYRRDLHRRADGRRPELLGRRAPVRLDALPVPMQVGVSTRYWQFAEPDDPRLTIEPDVTIPVTAADYFGGEDPALEAALGTTARRPD